MDNASETLSCPSFATAPDRHQLYLTEAHRDNLAMIKAWTKFDRGLLVLSGPSRIGKTVQALEFMALSSGSMKIGRVSLDRQGIDLSQEVPKAFGISSAEPLSDLARLLEKCRAAYKKCVLIVDNAHLISEASKAFLEEFTAASGLQQPLYVLLVGRGEAAALLDPPVNEELRRRIGGHLRMQPFAQAETAQYIAHRFRVRKCQCHGGHQPFDAGGLWLIHMASGGYPGHIDRLVQHCLARERAAPGGILDETAVHTFLAELAQAGTLPQPLPDLPAGGYKDEPLPEEEPTAPLSFQGAETEAVPEYSPSLQMDDPPARQWLKPAVAGAVVIGLVAVTGYVMTAGDGPEAPLPDTQSAAVQEPVPNVVPQPVAEPEPQPVIEPDPQPVIVPEPQLAQLETRVEDAAPDPQDLLSQALAIGADDPQAAIALYTRAALWGSDRAAYYLGQLHETGIGVDADPNTARAWYRQAPQIAGAVARLRDLETALLVTAATDPAAPIPERQTVLGTGQAELYWRSASGPGPARYRVEFIETGTEDVQALETDLTAALIRQPVSRWRVVALRGDGTPGPASDWAVTDAGAP